MGVVFLIQILYLALSSRYRAHHRSREEIYISNMAFTNMGVNNTAPVDGPNCGGEGAWKLPGWGEPVLVASILVASMWYTRRREYSMLGTGMKRTSGLFTPDPDSPRSSDDLLSRDYMIRAPSSDDSTDEYISTLKDPPKRRRMCGLILYTPNTSRFADHVHSRILQKFPFLIEMFYWIITFAFYHGTKGLSRALFSKTKVWDVAQDHGLAIMEFEQFSWLSFLWPVTELSVQQWFINGHQTFLTVLNRSYALIHIPGTVGFIAWYYYVAPSHNTFATVRRTLTLTNLLAFTLFVFYPTMPPRLLPQEYGFLDTVHHADAQSVWMEGNFVNALAAMPSMHFGYSFCIGCTMIYHSGIFRSRLEPGEVRKTFFWKVFYILFGLGYPAWIMITIIATANHYYLDAAVATIVAIVAFLCNKIFLALLPLEDLLLWCLRLEKPVPTTGDRFHQRGGRL